MTVPKSNDDESKYIYPSALQTLTQLSLPLRDVLLLLPHFIDEETEARSTR